MKTYVKPDIEVTTFVPNEAVAANGCKHIDAANPTEATVKCVIGKQSETVFLSGNTSCTTKSTIHAVINDYGEDKKDYFIWYTYAGDTGSGGDPDSSVTALLNALVKEAKYTPGSGWHYAEVNADSTNAYDTLKLS